jgi:hypothetical protein
MPTPARASGVHIVALLLKDELTEPQATLEHSVLGEGGSCVFQVSERWEIDLCHIIPQGFFQGRQKLLGFLHAEHWVPGFEVFVNDSPYVMRGPCAKDSPNVPIPWAP